MKRSLTQSTQIVLLGLVLFAGWWLALHLSGSASAAPLLAAPAPLSWQADQSRPLTATGTITGIVTDVDGARPINITVSAYEVLPDGTVAYYYTSYSAPLDESGRYTLTSVVPGTYRIGFNEPAFMFSIPRYYAQYFDGAADLESAADIVVTPGAVIPNVNARLERYGIIRGHVTDEDGNPLSGILVSLFRDQDSDGMWGPYFGRLPRATTLDGAFEFFGLEPEFHRLGFSDMMTGGLTAEYFNDVPDLAHALNLSPTRNTIITANAALVGPRGRILGTVTDLDGQHLADTHVGAYYFDQHGEVQIARGGRTDAAGHYAVNGLPAGSYYLYFFPDSPHVPAYYEQADDLADATPVTVAADATVTGIDMALTPFGRITGLVTDVEGNPLADIVVVSYFFYNSAWTAGYSPTSRTGIDGRYVLPVAEETYRLEFYDVQAPPRYIRSFYGGGLDVNNAADVTLTNHSTVTVNMQLLSVSILTEHVHLPLISPSD
jgi:hypothetical protein